LLGRAEATLGPVGPILIGSGLSIVNGALTAAGATDLSYDPATRVLSSSTGADVTLPLATATLPGLVPSAPAAVAYSGDYGDLLNPPTLGTAAAADVGAFATAAQGVLAATAVQPADIVDFVHDTDVRLADAREWTAATVTQAIAEGGSDTARYAWTSERIRQAAAAAITAAGITPIASTDDLTEGTTNLYYTVARVGTWWTGVSTAVGRALVTAADVASQRLALGLGNSATRDVGTAGGTVAAGNDNRFMIFTAGTPANLGHVAAVGTSASPARLDHVHRFQPADIVIPLTGDRQTLWVDTVMTIPRWPRDCILETIPLWSVNTAATGATIQLDIRVAGVSIFATLPTIDAGELGSDTAAVPAVFSAAFTTAGFRINRLSVVTFHVLQVGISPGIGAGLKVAIPARRAAA
jgi:hypothetical protein